MRAGYPGSQRASEWSKFARRRDDGRAEGGELVAELLRFGGTHRDDEAVDTELRHAFRVGDRARASDGHLDGVWVATDELGLHAHLGDHACQRFVEVEPRADEREVAVPVLG